jgi:hypothetical protein
VNASLVDACTDWYTDNGVIRKHTSGAWVTMGAADNRVRRIKCARCGRDWSDELATRVTGIAGTLWQVMCSCGAELYAEGTEFGVRLVAGLEQRPG